MDIMVCRTCQVEKPVEEFRLRRDKGYRERSCKGCRYEQAKRNPNREKNVRKYRDSEKYAISMRKSVVSKYGLTIEEYNQMYEAQGGLCAICQLPEARNNRMLSVDHCHKNGQVRALLCDNCNSILGRVKDSPEHAMSIYNYLLEKRP